MLQLQTLSPLVPPECHLGWGIKREQLLSIAHVIEETVKHLHLVVLTIQKLITFNLLASLAGQPVARVWPTRLPVGCMDAILPSGFRL